MVQLNICIYYFCIGVVKVIEDGGGGGGGDGAGDAMFTNKEINARQVG